MKTSTSPTTVMTAKDEVQTRKEARKYNWTHSLKLCFLKRTPPNYALEMTIHQNLASLFSSHIAETNGISESALHRMKNKTSGAAAMLSGSMVGRLSVIAICVTFQIFHMKCRSEFSATGQTPFGAIVEYRHISATHRDCTNLTQKYDQEFSSVLCCMW